MITEEMLPALQGVVPSALATSDNNGVPNVSYISQVFYVDSKHVAISNQFFNKSMRNIHENGKATINVIVPGSMATWYFYMQHTGSQTDGELFENMNMQLEAIASMSGMEDIFKLVAAEVFEVLEIVEIPT